VKIGFAFAGTEFHSLEGDHSLKLEVSLKDYPQFDYFLKQTFDFKLTVTSACSKTTFGSLNPRPKIVTFKVYDDKDANLLTLDAPMDSISVLAINSYSRAAPPTKVPFCSRAKNSIKVMVWKPTYWYKYYWCRTCAPTYRPSK